MSVVRFLTRALAALAALAVAGLTVFADAPAADIVRQGAPQAALALLCFAVLLLGLRQARTAIMAGLTAAALAGPLIAVGAPSPMARTEPALSILFHNVHDGRADLSILKEMIDQFDPDVLAFVEAYGGYEDRLAAIAPAYPYRYKPEDSYALILSKTPLAPCPALPEPAYWEGGGCGALETRIGPLQLAVAHIARPWPFRRPKDQRRDADEIALALAASRNVPTLLVGDFNATPWGAIAKRLTASGVSAVGGLDGTWPAVFPWFLRAPIDNGFISPELRAVEKRVLRETGSDHLPVLYRIQRARPLSRSPAVVTAAQTAHIGK